MFTRNRLFFLGAGALVFSAALLSFLYLIRDRTGGRAAIHAARPVIPRSGRTAGALTGVPADGLPGLLAGYAAYVRWHAGIEYLRLGVPLPDVYSVMSARLHRLKVGLSTGLGFASQLFLMQDPRSGCVAGVLRGRGGQIRFTDRDSPTSAFFVGPLPRTRGVTLIIVAGEKPEETTIASVDPALDFRLLYDSFKMVPKGSVVLGTVIGVEADSNDTFLLFDYRNRFLRPPGSPAVRLSRFSLGRDGTVAARVVALRRMDVHGRAVARPR